MVLAAVAQYGCMLKYVASELKAGKRWCLLLWRRMD